MSKEQKFVVYLVIALFLVIVAGTTYAFFTAGVASVESSTTLKARAGEMKIDYEGGSSIVLSGIYPSDTAWATKNFTVTGKNTTDLVMYYKVLLVVEENSFNNDEIAYSLNSGNATNGSIISSIDNEYINGTGTINIGTGSFNKTGSTSAVHSYTLNINYPLKDVQQNANQGASMKCHIDIKEQNYNIISTLDLDDATVTLGFENGNQIAFNKNNNNNELVYEIHFSVVGNNDNLDKIIGYTITLNNTTNTFSDLNYILTKDNSNEEGLIGNVSGSSQKIDVSGFNENCSNETQNYTLKFYSSGKGAYAGNITISALVAKMPKKGDIITMDIGDDLPSNFRVLKTNGVQASLLSMTNYDNTIFNPGGEYMINFSDGKSTFIGLRYDSSAVDLLLNDYFYSALDDDIKDAIIPQELKQNMYSISTTAPTNGIQGKDYWASSYNFTSAINYYINKVGSNKKTLFNTLVTKKNVYLLDVEDVLNYFNNEAFTSAQLNELFFNQKTATSEDMENCLWLRSASRSSQNDACTIDGHLGKISFANYTVPNSARVAFTIDLSNITWE